MYLELMQPLLFPEMRDRRDSIRTPHPATCEWILSHEIYQAWVDDQQGLLWIKGKPGSGKSVLMSFLFNHWKEQYDQGEVVSLQHFCSRRGIELQHSRIGMLRSPLWQILNSQPAASLQIDHSFQQKLNFRPPKDIVWSVEELEHSLIQVLQDLSRSAKISTVIDALDETDPQDSSHVIQYFHRIHGHVVSGKAPVKLCVSSRHYPAVVVTNATREIVVESNDGHDITRLIQDQLGVYRQNLGTAHHAPLDEATLWLSSRAMGLFQWVSLVLPWVANMLTDGRLAELEDLGTSLQNVAGDLGGLYTHIIMHMIKKDKLIVSLTLFRFDTLKDHRFSIPAVAIIRLASSGDYCSLSQVQSLMLARALVEQGATVSEEQWAKLYPADFVKLGENFYEIEWAEIGKEMIHRMRRQMYLGHTEESSWRTHEYS